MISFRLTVFGLLTIYKDFYILETNKFGSKDNK